MENQENQQQQDLPLDEDWLDKDWLEKILEETHVEEDVLHFRMSQAQRWFGSTLLISFIWILQWQCLTVLQE